MQNENTLFPPSGISSERLNNSFYSAEKEKSLSYRSGMNDNILDDLVSIDMPAQNSNRSHKQYLEPPSSGNKNFQSPSKDPMEYIFAENHSSIYYTENLGDQSKREFDSENYKQDQSEEEAREDINEAKKSLSSFDRSEQPSRNNGNSIVVKQRLEESEAYEDRSISILEKDSLSNGVIIDPVLVYEEKAFVVMSVLNDIPGKQKPGQEGNNTINTTNTSLTSVTKRKEDSFIFRRCQEEIKQSEMQIKGLKNLKSEISDFVSNLNKQLAGHDLRSYEKNYNMISPRINEPLMTEATVTSNNKSSSRENIEDYIDPSGHEADSMISFRKKPHAAIGNTRDDPVYLQKREDLVRMNQKILETEIESEPIADLVPNHPLIKKTLSVIFSTNESAETNSNKGSVKNLTSQAGAKGSDHSLNSQVRTASRSLMTQDSETLKNKESVSTPFLREPFNEETFSSGNNDEENFMSFLSMIKYQNKDNKDLSDKLSRLMELHNKEIEKYEINANTLVEKNKKFSHGNELLIKTLKSFEKEMDKLAQNNQILHKNLVFLQEEVKIHENKERQAKETMLQQENTINKLKEELRIKSNEIEEAKKKLIHTSAKVDNLGSYAQSCEDSILIVNQVLKEILNNKTGRVSSKQIYSALETIYTGVSKFVDRLDTKIKFGDVYGSIIGSRKSSCLTRDESLLAHDLQQLSSKRESSLSKTSGGSYSQDKKPWKTVSKSIDLSNNQKSSSIINKGVMNRHRQHSLVENNTSGKYEDKENISRNLSARGRARQKSTDKVKVRLDKSAPVRENQYSNKYIAKTNKNVIETEVEHNLRKRLIDNLKIKDNKTK